MARGRRRQVGLGTLRVVADRLCEYVLACTNAATIINDDFRGAEGRGGLCSGFDMGSWSCKARPH